jgi:alkylation response protein AidB-like acyl-CoA dehydrogenase
VLNGSKCWITNGGKSTWYTVMAVTDPRQGRQRHLGVRRASRTTRASRSAPRNASSASRARPTTELYFENCRIPATGIIGEPGTGFKTALATPRTHPPDHRRAGRRHRAGRARRGDRLHQGAQAVRQAVSDFQGVQFMLADMAMKVEAARLMVYSAAARAERGEPTLSFISSAAKCFASDVAMEVTTDAVQLFGGAGYTVDFPVERMMRDAKITQIYEGTNQIQRVVMARALLRDSSVVIGSPMSVDRVVGGKDRRYRVITAMGPSPPG